MMTVMLANFGEESVTDTTAAWRRQKSALPTESVTISVSLQQPSCDLLWHGAITRGFGPEIWHLPVIFVRLLANIVQRISTPNTFFIARPLGGVFMQLCTCHGD